MHDISHCFPPPVGYGYLNLFKDAEQQSIEELPSLLPKELGLKHLRSIITYKLIDSKAAKDVYSVLSAEFKNAIEIFSSCCSQGIVPARVTDILTEFHCAGLNQCAS